MDGWKSGCDVKKYDGRWPSITCHLLDESKISFIHGSRALLFTSLPISLTNHTDFEPCPCSLLDTQLWRMRKLATHRKLGENRIFPFFNLDWWELCLAMDQKKGCATRPLCLPTYCSQCLRLNKCGFGNSQTIWTKPHNQEIGVDEISIIISWKLWKLWIHVAPPSLLPTKAPKQIAESTWNPHNPPTNQPTYLRALCHSIAINTSTTTETFIRSIAFEIYVSQQWTSVEFLCAQKVLIHGLFVAQRDEQLEQF